jgi:DNA polymerase-3 subunit gamma/tau
MEINNDLLPWYIKHRPNKFSEFAGSESLKNQYEYLIKKFPCKILITGLYGSGKTILGKIMMLGSNCEDLKNGNPCLSCESCKCLLDLHFWGDCFFISGANLNNALFADIEKRLSFVPSLLKQRILFIDDVDLASTDALGKLISFINDNNHIPTIMTASNSERLPLPVRQRFYTVQLGKYRLEDLQKLVKETCIKENMQYEIEATEILVKQARFNPRVIMNGLEFIKAEQSIVDCNIVRTQRLIDFMKLQTSNSDSVI